MVFLAITIVFVTTFSMVFSFGIPWISKAP